MHSEIGQQQGAADSDCSSQTSSLFFMLQQLFFFLGIFTSIISALVQQERDLFETELLSAVSHPHSSKEAPSGSLSSPAQL